MLYVMSVFLTPTANRHVDLYMSKAVADVTKIVDTNWCSYVLKTLCEGIQKCQKKFNKSYGVCSGTSDHIFPSVSLCVIWWFKCTIWVYICTVLVYFTFLLLSDLFLSMYYLSFMFRGDHAPTNSNCLLFNIGRIN